MPRDSDPKRLSKQGIEVWIPIPEYEGFYEVSNLGRVRSVTRYVRQARGGGTRRVASKILSPGKINEWGHLIVHLHKGIGGKCALVHHLVLFAFVGPCPLGMECRHYPDRDPTNNRLCNIKWGTPRRNQHDRFVHGTDSSGEKCYNAKITNDTAMQIAAFVRKGHDNRWIGRRLGVDTDVVYAIRSGVAWGRVTGIQPGEFGPLKPGPKVGDIYKGSNAVRVGDTTLTEIYHKEPRELPFKLVRDRYLIGWKLEAALTIPKGTRFKKHQTDHLRGSGR